MQTFKRQEQPEVAHLFLPAISTIFETCRFTYSDKAQNCKRQEQSEATRLPLDNTFAVIYNKGVITSKTVFTERKLIYD